MNITCTHENLHKALGLVSRVVGNRNNLPVLANVLLQTEKGRVKISATDLEIGLVTRIGAKVEEEGAISVPSRAFGELIASVADPTITLKTEGAILHISGDTTKATLRGIDAEEFPVIPTLEVKDAISIPGPAFLQALKQVVIAVAPDDSRPTLAGLLIRAEKDVLTCVGTDSYRLAEKTIKLDHNVSASTEAIVPSRSINELARIIGIAVPDQIQLVLHDNQILFSFADTEFVSRIIDGKYPDYHKIIPKDSVTRATVQNDAFKAILRTATIFARESANTVSLQFATTGLITIKALAESLGEASVEVKADVDGEETKASFNVRYIADALGAIPSSQIHLALSGPLQPALITGTDAPDYRYVIMPLKTD